MRIAVAFLLFLSVSVNAFAVSMRDNGYDWEQYNRKERVELVKKIYHKLKINRKKVPLAAAILNIQTVYSSGGKNAKNIKAAEIIKRTAAEYTDNR